MQIILTTLLIYIVLQLLIFRVGIFRWSSIPSWLISAVFSLKFLVILGFVWALDFFPQFDLKGDHNHFINDSEILADVFKDNPAEYFKLLTGLESDSIVEANYLKETNLWFTAFERFNDSRTVIRFHSIIGLFFQGEAVHLLVVALISTLSMLFLVEAFKKRIQHRRIYFLLLSLGLPILLIYGGLVLKEHILILGISLVIYGISKKNIRSYHLWIGFFFLTMVKLYILIAILISLFVYFTLLLKKASTKLILSVTSVLILIVIYNSSITDRITSRITKKQYAFHNVATPGLYLYDENTRSHYYIVNLEDTSNFEEIGEGKFRVLKSTNGYLFKDHASYQKEEVQLVKNQMYDLAMKVKKPSKSYIEPLYLDSEKSKLISYSIKAINRGLFTPNLTSPGSSAKIPAIIEMLIVIFLFFTSILFAFIRNKEKLKSPIIISLFAFILISSYFVGLTTPIIGAIVRYRIPAYIAIVTFSFILIDLTWKRKPL